MPTTQQETIANADMITDAQAQALLPPNRLAQTTYAALRSEGYDCQTALHKTQETWREYWQSARPQIVRGQQ